MIKHLTSSLLGALCVLTVGGFQHSKLSQLTSSTKDISTQSNYSRIEQPAEQLKILKNIPSIGFRNFIADWNFLQFLQYFGDEDLRNVSGYGLSPEYLSVVLARDPYYKDFYLFLSESTTFYAGMPNRTVDLMAKGLSYLKENRAPDSYYIWRYKGTDELLFLDKAKAAQHSFEMAAEWAEKSSEENSKFMASLSRQTANFLASDPDSTPAKIGAWGNILVSSRDEQTQARAVQNIRALGGRVSISETGRVSIEYPPTSKRED